MSPVGHRAGECQFEGPLACDQVYDILPERLEGGAWGVGVEADGPFGRTLKMTCKTG